MIKSARIKDVWFVSQHTWRISDVRRIIACVKWAPVLHQPLVSLGILGTIDDGVIHIVMNICHVVKQSYVQYTVRASGATRTPLNVNTGDVKYAVQAQTIAVVPNIRLVAACAMYPCAG